MNIDKQRLDFRKLFELFKQTQAVSAQSLDSKKDFILNKKPVQQIIRKLKVKLPLLEFSCWSTEQINSFTHHLLELKPPPLVAVMGYGFALRIFLFFAALAAP